MFKMYLFFVVLNLISSTLMIFRFKTNKKLRDALKNKKDDSNDNDNTIVKFLKAIFLEFIPLVHFITLGMTLYFFVGEEKSVINLIDRIYK